MADSSRIELPWSEDDLTFVYRLKDCDDKLLYVGVTSDFSRRLKEHSEEKPWWDEVERIDIERWAWRPFALSIEATAIRDEAPVHNIQGRSRA